ncbi:tetratricopeptide repeat protein [Catalinimonas sp. 4WD22]|uniref:tetratricopeptide repeat protein n=1 Tax=Catalinimonas locisalis TaxID=3133978 RepID=UPI003101B290
MKLCWLTFFLLLNQAAYSQLLDFSRAIPYLAVFEETDDFDTTYLSELELAVSQLPLDSLKLQLLNDLGYYYHTRNLNTALDYIEEGLGLARQLNNQRWEGKFQISQGAVLLRMEKLDLAEEVLNEAIDKVLPADRWLLYTNLGYVYERRGMLDKASSYAMQTLQLGEKIGLDRAKAMAYSDLSCLFWKQGKFEQALEYSLESIALYEKRGIQDLDYDFTLYLVGNNYLALNRHQEALDYYEKSIRMGEQYGFYNNLSDVYISLADLYASQETLPEAEKAGQEALKYARLLENNFMIMRSLLSLGKIYNQEAKYEEAEESLQMSLSVATEDFGDKFFLNQVYEALATAYEGQAQYDKAYRAMQQHDLLEDQVFTSDADQRLAELQTQLEVVQKENTIQLQQNQLKQQATFQFLMVIILVLLASFLLFLYQTYQQKKKHNLILARKNQEMEFLLKEIHHRVKNNLEVVSSLLSLQAHEQDGQLHEVMVENQNRVQSMSIIHEKLYQGENLSTIEMKDYFLNLGSYVIHMYAAEERVQLRCDMAAIEVDVDMAIPVGLIVNELLTNALKYAFPDGRKGHISISLTQKDKLLLLEVADNGVGRRQEESHESKGFGSELVRLLTRQLEGKMRLDMQQGTTVQFEFQMSKAA